MKQPEAEEGGRAGEHAAARSAPAEARLLSPHGPCRGRGAGTTANVCGDVDRETGRLGGGQKRTSGKLHRGCPPPPRSRPPGPETQDGPTQRVPPAPSRSAHEDLRDDPPPLPGQQILTTAPSESPRLPGASVCENRVSARRGHARRVRVATTEAFIGKNVVCETCVRLDSLSSHARA